MPGVFSLKEHPLPIASPTFGGMQPVGQPGLFMHAWVLVGGPQALTYRQLIFCNSTGAYDSLVPAPQALNATSGWQAD